MNSKDIAGRAYAIWEMAGHPQGKAVDHWLQAESEIAEVGHALSRGNSGNSSVPAPKVLKGKKASRAALSSSC